MHRAALHIQRAEDLLFGRSFANTRSSAYRAPKRRGVPQSQPAGIKFDFTKQNAGDVLVWSNIDGTKEEPTREGIHTVHPVVQGEKKILQFWVRIQPRCRGSSPPPSNIKQRSGLWKYTQERILRKLTLDKLTVPQFFEGLIDGQLLNDVTAYEGTIPMPDNKTNKKRASGYMQDEGDGRCKAQAQGVHRFRAEPKDQRWDGIKHRILQRISNAIMDRLYLDNIDLRGKCEMDLVYNDGGFVVVRPSNGPAWTHHDVSELIDHDDGSVNEIDLDDFLRRNRITEREGKISMRMQERLHMQEMNLGRELTVIVQLKGPAKGGTTEFIHTNYKRPDSTRHSRAGGLQRDSQGPARSRRRGSHKGRSPSSGSQKRGKSTKR